jgi:putative ABC transport system substrate-binding protein
LLAVAVRSARAQQQMKQHRIAIVVAAGPVAGISDTGVRVWQAFFAELRLLGDVEGQNLAVGRYSGGGRPESYADLAREVVNSSPDVIIAGGTAIAHAVRAATATVPIVWVGGDDPIQAGLAMSLARPGDNLTGVHIFAGNEIWGKSLQILKEAIPWASKVAFLTTRTVVEDEQQLREASRRLEISLISMLFEEATPAQIQHAFAATAQGRPDAIVVSATGELLPYRQLIVELVEKAACRQCMPGASTSRRVG